MQLYPVKGSRFYIGAAVYSIPNEDVDAADFTSVVWTQVKGWSQMGDITDSQAEITESVIDLGRDLSTKGTFNAPRQNHRFIPISDDAGQLAMRAAAQTNYNYPMKVEWDDAPPSRSNAATISIAAPGVITWTAHGLAVDKPVKFSTTGALPTGLVAGTTYYVKTAPDANTFTVAATVGGAAITTTGTQSGVHTAIAPGTPSIDQWIGLVFPGTRAGGQANTARMVAFDVKPNTNILSIDPVVA
jgi:hypothetical protein